MYNKKIDLGKKTQEEKKPLKKKYAEKNPGIKNPPEHKKKINQCI